MIAQPLDYLMRVYLLSPSIILPEVASIHDHHTRKVSNSDIILAEKRLCAWTISGLACRIIFSSCFFTECD